MTAPASAPGTELALPELVPALRELVQVAQRLCGTSAAYVAVPGPRGPTVLAWTGEPPAVGDVSLVEAPEADTSSARTPLPGAGGVLAVWGGPRRPLDLHLPTLGVLADTVAARLARTAPSPWEHPLDRAGLLRTAERGRGDGPLALLVLAVTAAAGSGGLAPAALAEEVARRLRTQVRPGDTLARLADGTWAVLLADLPAGARYVALGVADRLSRTLAAPLDAAVGPALALASTGLAFCAGTDDPAAVLAQAEHAAAVAVRRGPGRFHVHRDPGPVDATDDVHVERLLRDALDHDALVVHYQPVVGLTSRTVVGVEALVRLRGPDGALVPPDRFIPIAERCGLIGALGDQVRRTAMHTVAGWKRALPANQDLGLGVNLSVHELGAPGLVASLRSALEQSGLDPAALNLEITESAFLEEGRGHEQVLAELRTLGPKLFIDDFGTGFSSLSYLRRFPVDGLKIDRSFVGDLLSGPQPRAVTASIVHLAQALGVHVVAEGVETEQQADLLTGHGCRLAQGYLFSRPVPADDVLALLLPGPRAAAD